MLIAILSLIAGFLSILAPCVLPLLPIIIGGSFTGQESKKRPYIIAVSLVFSLILFTILLKISTSLIGIDPKVWSYISGTIIILLGITILFPDLWDKIIGTLGIQARSQKLLGDAGKLKNGTLSAVLTGLALGPVFSSCSPMYGWVIATVLPESKARGLFYLSFYCIGLTIALLLIALLGRRLLDKIKWASNPHGWFQKVIAIIFIIVGLAIFTGFDKTFQTYLVDKDFLNLKTLEEKLIPSDEDSSVEQNQQIETVKGQELYNVKAYDAPELAGLQDWINSDPRTLDSLKGRVVLIDFWTYSCINCIRTLPYLQTWYDTYKDDGFVIIGVHAPEFAFEKVPENVQNAVKDRGLTYPIALDNSFSTWKAYKNQFWPAHYLIDKNGQVRRTHFGEGEYEEMEKAIQGLLTETGVKDLGTLTTRDGPAPVVQGQTPETYIGGARAERNTNDKLVRGSHLYTLSNTQEPDTWSLAGTWDIQDDYGKCVSDCRIQLSYNAKDVYAVFSSDSKGTVIVDGGAININSDDLYTIVSNAKFSVGKISIELSPGLSIHAFTFGG